MLMVLNLFKNCNKSLDKRYGGSDWNKDIEELSINIEYASNDVIYLHKIKLELEKCF